MDLTDSSPHNWHLPGEEAIHSSSQARLLALFSARMPDCRKFRTARRQPEEVDVCLFELGNSSLHGIVSRLHLCFPLLPHLPPV